ncbi:MAG: FixH family protein [Planctomycetota bacterium]
MAAKSPVLVAVLAMSWILTVAMGCGGKSENEPTTSAATHEAQVATSDGGAFQVKLKTLPAPLETNEHFRLTVQITALEGASLEGIEVTADADMPAHGHGMNTKPITSKTGDGQYEVEGFLFHMPGYWELYVDIMRAGQRERATFSFNLD